MILTFLLVMIFVSIVGRLITVPLRYGLRRPRSYYGCDNPYLYGCRRHHRLVGSLLPIVMLVALDRIFRRRF